jgi:hypothetical protein
MILWRAEGLRATFGYKTQSGMVVVCAPYMRQKIIGKTSGFAKQYLEKQGFTVECLD